MMFTGIIETVGRVQSVGQKGDYIILTVSPIKMFKELIPGESIAIDGCCLTVTRVDKKSFEVEASPESRRTTIIGSYHSGRMVNLERALIAGGRIGGHFVSGHIDSCGQIDKIGREGNILEISIEYPEQYSELVIEKGSMAINGISLTINSVRANECRVNLIPHTRQETTVDDWRRGMKVNLEFDMIGKYIMRVMRCGFPDGVTLEKLIKSGWSA